jgi:hypothetical protein
MTSDPGSGWVTAVSGYKIGGSMDTAIARNAPGIAEIDNGTLGSFSGTGLITGTVNATVGFQNNGLAYSNYTLTGQGTYFVQKAQYISNGSSAQQTGFAADQYMTGSTITVNAGDFTVGTTYHCSFDMAKTGAGTAGIIISIRVGTAGTTADTAVQTITFGAQTAVADTGTFDVYVNFRAVGASATVSSVGRLTHSSGGATGLITTPSATISNSTSSTFSSTSATKIGISFNGGTSFSGTNNTVQADLHQP